MKQCLRLEKAIGRQRSPLLMMSAFLPLLYLIMVRPAVAGTPIPSTEYTIFAGREERVVIKDGEGLPAGDSRVWYSINKDSRTITRGTARVESDGSVALSVSLPELKPGVAMRFDLEIRAGSDQGPRVKGATLWALSEKPRVSGFKPAGERQLLLYDPAGNTEKAFQSIGLACESAGRLETLVDATNAVIVVGEGVSLESERALGDVLIAAVLRGNRVLLLAPTDGVVKPPEGGPRRLLAGAAVAVLGGERKAGSPTLDFGLYSPTNSLNKAFFRLGSDESGGTTITVNLESGEQSVGWDYVQKTGRFRACGLGLVEQWDKKPSMRWFLMEMIEELNKEK